MNPALAERGALCYQLRPSVSALADAALIATAHAYQYTPKPQPSGVDDVAGGAGGAPKKVHPLGLPEDP